MSWISVKKRLPNKYVNVLAVSKFGKYSITCVGSDNTLDDFELEVNQSDSWTHWMWIPKKPETLKKKKKS